MLELDWYIKSPIDFEYKNYILLDYLSKMDNAFAIHKLSPYLLYTEKLIKELNNFKLKAISFKESLKKEFKGITSNGIIYEEIKTPDNILEIFEIIDYSKPLLEVKLKVGYKLFEKFPQILY